MTSNIICTRRRMGSNFKPLFIHLFIHSLFTVNLNTLFVLHFESAHDDLLEGRHVDGLHEDVPGDVDEVLDVGGEEVLLQVRLAGPDLDEGVVGAAVVVGLEKKKENLDLVEIERSEGKDILLLALHVDFGEKNLAVFFSSHFCHWCNLRRYSYPRMNTVNAF